MSTVSFDVDRKVYRNERGELHREGGPAVCKAYDIMEWWENGKRHRLDGPAIERANGYKEWRQHGKLHRLDGPAIEYPDGYGIWYIYDDGETSILQKLIPLKRLNAFLKLTILQNKSRKFNEWLFDPDHYAGKWHKKNMLRDFQDS